MTLKYIWYCYRNAHKTFSGRLGIFMMIFAMAIFFSSNIVTLHRFDLNEKVILIFLMLIGSGGEIIAPTAKVKFLFATPILFYLFYGVFISLFDFGLYTGTAIFGYLLLEILIGISRRR